MQNPSTFISLSIAGALFAILGTLISAFAYQGKNGTSFSPLNHFISELGEVGVSRLAWVFNVGLILSGVCLFPACVSLGVILPGVLSKFGMVSGVITAVGLTFVGVYPMNNLKPHGKAALTFFRGGLVMVLTFSLAIAFQPEQIRVMPPVFSLAGLPAIFSFAAFLGMMRKPSTADADDPLQPKADERPKFWLMPTVEWSIFLTIVLWFVVIATGLV